VTKNERNILELLKNLKKHRFILISLDFNNITFQEIFYNGLIESLKYIKVEKIIFTRLYFENYHICMLNFSNFENLNYLGFNVHTNNKKLINFFNNLKIPKSLTELSIY
jgi:hypothetical protein